MPRTPAKKTTRLTRGSQSQAKILSTSSSHSSSTLQSLKWNFQSERILSQLISLYQGGGNGDGEVGPTGSPLLTDVTLFSSDGECIPAHKIILMLSSPFFHKLFTQISISQKDHNNGSPAVIVLGNVNSSHLRNLIRLIYTSQCSIAPSQLEEFHQVALQFGVEGLLTSSSSKSTTNTKPPSQPQTSHSQPQSDVIKVHIIDQRRQPEQDDHSHQDSSMEESPTASRIPPCKTEPSEESDAGNGDDDHLSNFSDDLSHQGHLSEDDDDDKDDDDPSTNYVPPKAKPRPRSSPSSLPSRKGVHTWLKLEPPPTPSQLKSDWRVSGRFKYATFTGHTYYCAQGYRQSCPAEIKSKTLHDGSIFWFKNDKLHDNHKPPDYQFGLTEQQKNFVVKCLETGVVMPRDIFLKMDLEGIEKPSRIKLAGMLQRYRKKNPDKIWKRLASSSLSRGSRRIRKFSKKPPPSSRTGEGGNTSPRKRGRPPLAKTSASSTIPPIIPFTTTSALVPPSSTAGNIYQTFHPNHYPSQAAAVLSFPPFTTTSTSLQNLTSSTSTQQQPQHSTYPFMNF